MERTRWGLIALIFFGGLLAAAQFGKISLTLPQMAQTFDRPVAAVAFLVSLVGMIGLVFGAMAGASPRALALGGRFWPG